MGWSSGVPICRSAWTALRPFVEPHRRLVALTDLLIVFMRADCDNLDELEGEWPEFSYAFELAYRHIKRHDSDRRDQEPT